MGASSLTGFSSTGLAVADSYEDHCFVSSMSTTSCVFVVDGVFLSFFSFLSMKLSLLGLWPALSQALIAGTRLNISMDGSSSLMVRRSLKLLSSRQFMSVVFILFTWENPLSHSAEDAGIVRLLKVLSKCLHP